jgi:predicted transposase YdaD
MPYVTSIEQSAEERGRLQGLITTTLEGIKLGLELKFGSDGLNLLSEIYQIHDLEVLKSIQEGLRHVNSIDELRTFYHIQVPKKPYITSIERRAQERGFRQGLLERIELGLEVKFGREGLELLPEISQIRDIEVLETVFGSITRATTLTELRTAYQTSDSQNT